MKYYVLFALLLIFPELSYAHGQLSADGFVSGLLHPVLGIDHLLAMLAVGVASTLMHRYAVITAPATFVLVMALSAYLAMQGWYLSYIELGISVSVLILGALIHLLVKFKSSWLSLLMYLAIALFAVFHGYAHGSEIPQAANPIHFLAGFVLATAAIHCAGVLFAYNKGHGVSSHYRVSHFATAITAVGAMMSYLYVESWWG
ncbi:HupE/UreJ family protein [Pseudoalteromonas sp. T1lg75]|uniref:HupE/UreJ family protein n=1 Tax=Pseudoalteromonas sp. T1lg75 TaxID=2077102 RepID=UPI000CF681B1|nr:HupE/UreJ family protein [Pseudoalteromonas sp. T1lg75]